jgi:hypothetical protein
MKKNYYLVSLGLLMSTSCPISFAQTCASPTTIVSSSTVAGNSCAAPTGTGDTTIGTLCSGLSNTGPVAVYTWVHGAGATAGNITVTPAATYNTAIAIGSGVDCATALGGFCDATADVGGVGVAETVPLSSAAAAKKYFLFISSFAIGASSCGAYSIAVGTLPVKLQSFSIN